MTIRNPIKGSLLAKKIIILSLLSILIVAAVTGILLGKVNRVMNEEIAKDNRYRLEQIRDSIEKNDLYRFEKMFAGGAWDEYTSGDIQYLLNHDGPVSMYRIMHLKESLQNICLADSMLSNVTLYFPDDNYTIDKNHYYSAPQHSPDESFIDRLPTVKRNTWFGRTTTGADGKSRELLTYVYALPHADRSTGDAEGYMVIDVDAEKLMDALRPNLNSPHEKLYVFQADGQLLLHSSLSVGTEDRLYALYAAHKDVYRYSGSSQDNEIVSFLNDSSMGWSYGLARQKNTMMLVTRNLTEDVIQISAFVLAAALIASTVIAYRLDLPTRKALDSIRELFLHDNSGNPYESRKLTSLKTYLHSKQIVDLALGLNTPDALLPHGREAGCRYAVCVLETEEDLVRRFEARIKQLPPQWKMDCGIVSNREMVILLTMEDQEPVDLNQLCDALDESTDACPDYVIGVGGWVECLEDVHESYLQARQALRYSFLLGRRTVIGYEQIRSRQDILVVRPAETLAVAVKSGDEERVDRYLNELLCGIHNHPVHIDAVELSVVQEVAALTKVILELDMQEVFSYPDIMKDYKKKTLEETIVWLSGLCRRITLEIRDRPNQQHVQLMTELKHYIDCNLQEDISLELLAEKASLSPSYVSSLFKETMHISFSEYLNEARLGEAARRLLDDPRATVASVSEQVGYRNVQYFITRFKGKFGMTPSQYRKTQPFIPQQSPV